MENLSSFTVLSALAPLLVLFFEIFLIFTCVLGEDAVQEVGIGEASLPCEDKCYCYVFRMIPLTDCLIDSADSLEVILLVSVAFFGNKVQSGCSNSFKWSTPCRSFFRRSRM